MSTLFKGVYYYLDISLAEHTIQGSTLFKGAYYLRKYGSSNKQRPDFETHKHGSVLSFVYILFFLVKSGTFQ